MFKTWTKCKGHASKPLRLTIRAEGELSSMILKNGVTHQVRRGNKLGDIESSFTTEAAAKSGTGTCDPFGEKRLTDSTFTGQIRSLC